MHTVQRGLGIRWWRRQVQVMEAGSFATGVRSCASTIASHASRCLRTTQTVPSRLDGS